MTLRLLPAAALVCAAFALLAGCAGGPTASPQASVLAPASAPTEPVRVRVLAINDFHGNLKAPPGGVRIADPANPGNLARRINVPAGGAAQMASALDALRVGQPNHIFVAAGDLIGATPLLSSLFRDEPTIEAMNLMGLEAAAMGNHELDRGPAELLRLQSGGCHPGEGCKGPAPFTGARFQYLAANTVVQATGKTLLPPYFVKTFQGIPVAFIGLTLKGTPAIVVPAGTAGLAFRDEAQTVNDLVPVLQTQGIEAMVLLIHEGGETVGDYNDCPGLSGAIVDIVKKLNKAVDVVVSGHTHRAYNCVVDGRPVTSADRYGTLVTQIDLVIDRQTRDVTSAKADNIIVRSDQFAPHPRVAELVATYERLVQPLARRPVGRLSAPLLTRSNEAGESPLGQVIADAQLMATRDAGAQVAFMNPGGVRAPLGGEGKLDVVYEELFAVQPFYNQLVTMTFTGAQLLQLLEQQFTGERPRTLHVSKSLNYSWDASRPAGQRVVPGSVLLNGRPVAPDAAVRITVNNFMADGGDGVTLLRQGRDRQPGPLDIDALEAYVKATPKLGPDPLPRVKRLN